MSNDKNIFLSQNLVDLIDIDYLYEDDNKRNEEDKLNINFEFENSDISIRKGKIQKLIKKSNEQNYKISLDLNKNEAQYFFINDEIKKIELNLDFEKRVFESDKYLIKYCIIYSNENNYNLKVIIKGI